MDWRRCGPLIVLSFLPFTSAWSAATHHNHPNALSSIKTSNPQQNGVTPYIDLIVCPIREEPWSCARQQSARILENWDSEIHLQWQKLKVEADRQLNATMEKRGYSASEVLTKEKPSTLLKKIEIGTNFMKEYLAETMDGFLGREYELMQKKRDDNDEDDDDESDNHDEDDEYEDLDEKKNEEDSSKISDQDSEALSANENSSNGNEFIEIDEDVENNSAGQLKRPGGKKKKKKGQASSAPATVVVLQQQPVSAHSDSEHGWQSSDSGGHGGGGKPLKQKRKKRKKHQHGGGQGVIVEGDEPSLDHHLGLGLLEELVGAGDLLDDVGGGKRKRKHPSKYGRSNGVTRGKKKKKKKALMKLILLGSFLKAKIELLLKILGAHLQIKFFAIALIGLLINIARFWIDVKRGGSPQKVVYVEHAHHQHHYEDQGDDWSEQGSYWKRSLQTDPTIEDDGHTDSYHPKAQQQSQYQHHQQQQQQLPHDAHYMAYHGQWQ